MLDNDPVMSLYPVAIIQDRYSGAYAGGAWLAIAKSDEMAQDYADRARVQYCLEDGPHGEDTVASVFWDNPPDWIASGRSPFAAVAQLMKKNGLGQLQRQCKCQSG